MKPSTMLITPDLDPEFGALPEAVRLEVRAWVRVLRNNPPQRPLKLWHERLAMQLNVSVSTVRSKLKTMQSGAGWRAFVDERKLANRASDFPPPGFKAYFEHLVESNQRSTDAAIRALYRAWKARHEIPGYEGHPGWPAYPQGWSVRNLRRLAPNQRDLTLIRHGSLAAKKYLPQNFTTRRGLWVGAAYMFDDVWHDNAVRHGSSMKPVRVLELGCIDFYSACRIRWGTMPRLKKSGKMESIKGRDMRMLLATVLKFDGYHPSGTMLLGENTTAAFDAHTKKTLMDSGLPLKADTSGIADMRRLIPGFWQGRGGGNPSFKAALESSHNLIHNELASLAGQLGMDRNHKPDQTYSIEKYQTQLNKLCSKIEKKFPADLIEKIKHPLIDYHSFTRALNHYYWDIINSRTDHNLEGWEEHIITLYTLDPNSEVWLSLEQFPEPTQSIILQVARANPELWSRCRRMSPAEVWNQGKSHLQKIPDHLYCDIISVDFAKEHKVNSCYIEFQDAEVSIDPLIYETRMIDENGRQSELKIGETYLIFPNPYNPDWLFVCDHKVRCLGRAPLYKKPMRVFDNVRHLEALANNAKRRAQLLQPLRIRHEDDVQALKEMKEHNAKIAQGKPATAEQIEEVRKQLSEDRTKAKATEKLLTPSPTKPTLVPQPIEVEVDPLDAFIP